MYDTVTIVFGLSLLANILFIFILGRKQEHTIAWRGVIATLTTFGYLAWVGTMIGSGYITSGDQLLAMMGWLLGAVSSFYFSMEAHDRTQSPADTVMRGRR